MKHQKKNFSKKNNYFKMNMNNVSVPNRVGSLQSLKYDIMNDQLSIKNNDYETDELDFDKHTSSSKQNETLHKVIISISSLPQHYYDQTNANIHQHHQQTQLQQPPVSIIFHVASNDDIQTNLETTIQTVYSAGTLTNLTIQESQLKRTDIFRSESTKLYETKENYVEEKKHQHLSNLSSSSTIFNKKNHNIVFTRCMCCNTCPLMMIKNSTNNEAINQPLKTLHFQQIDKTIYIGRYERSTNKKTSEFVDQIYKYLENKYSKVKRDDSIVQNISMTSSLDPLSTKILSKFTNFNRSKTSISSDTISLTSNNKSIERLQENYRHYLKYHQSLNRPQHIQFQTGDAYIRCPKHQQQVHVKLLPKENNKDNSLFYLVHSIPLTVKSINTLSSVISIDSSSKISSNLKNYTKKHFCSRISTNVSLLDISDCFHTD
ncbi:unnamed protein product [Didymodactylos carnosus]|uniref:Uncharacterized protein n=1 Tax=Didymodactylos carnosus TaxID=1234261 RepID=A0A814B737_9BILA|nr:unnamed protein product [Didymodactylos carnosus]CAF3703001.1 unnamed protein product [Didymodactylos carnosus]